MRLDPEDNIPPVGSVYSPCKLIERSRIVDALLDLRNTTSASSLVEVIDAALRSLPGRTTVRSSWWQGILDELNLAAELELNPS